MAQPTRPVSELVDFTGGLNSAEPPDQIGPGQVADVRNLEYRRTRGLKRRRGSVLNLTSPPFTAGTSLLNLFRHTPGQSEETMELWGVSNNATPEVARVAAGSAWASVAFPDAFANAPAAWFLRGVSFNGKLFLPYDSAVDRLHFWDGTQVRRVGLATPGTPTVANLGAGTYPAVPRYYKVQWLRIYADNRRATSPLSPASAVFTPSGAGIAARVTRPALPGEGEDTWLVFGSPDGINYYLLAGLAAATTTYDDVILPVNYPAAIPGYAGYPTQAGFFTPPISGKFLLVDNAQLLIAGSHETVGLSSTVFFTPALGSAGFDVADDERVPPTNRIDIDPQLGGGITGLGGPIGGTPVVFKLERTYLLNPTSDPTLPYTRQLLSDCVGCISYRGIVLAEDENGSPSLYWPSRRGVYRYGSAGLEYCGADIEDIWGGLTFDPFPLMHAVYHRDAGQIWFYVYLGSSLWTRLKFHVARARSTPGEGVRGGWTRDDGNAVLGTASSMFSDTPGNPMALRLKPYVAQQSTGGVVYKHDADGINRDENDATTYAAYVLTRALDRGIGEQFGVQDVYVQGVAESALSLAVSLRRNYDAADTVPAINVPIATQRGSVTAPGLEISECEALQIRVGDIAAANQHWSIDRIGIRVRAEAPKG